MRASAQFDVVIVGGGVVGLTLAAALLRSSTSISIALIDADVNEVLYTADRYHHRVSAITLASVRIFQSLGVWSAIKAMRVSPFTRIEVWNKSKPAQTLSFDSRDVYESRLGYIIENNVLQQALRESLRAYPQIQHVTSAAELFHADVDGVRITTQQGQVIDAKLAIAADGARSWLRQAAGIDVQAHNYEQSALVATVTTASPHGSVARQCFLPTGPLGFLPLATPNTCSIVWSLPQAEALHMLSVDAAVCQKALRSAIDNALGEITHIENRHVFPLKKLSANNYIAPRVALVGDAAHVVHPLAGQGVNMGLLDAACLAEVIADARTKDRDFAAQEILRRYERWRRADNSFLLQGVDVIKNIFGQRDNYLAICADYGLSVVNSLPFLKNIFTRHAVGNRNDLPHLARVP